MDGLGLTEAFGHLSCRLPDGDSILMTPALGPGLAHEEDLVEFSLDGSPSSQSGSEYSPAIESSLHLEFYRAFPEIGAICRTHSPYAVAYGRQLVPLHVCHGLGLMIGATVPVADFSNLISEAALAEKVVAAKNDSNAVLIRGNGAVAFGHSIRDAVVHAIYLEDAAAAECRFPSQAQRWSAGEVNDRCVWSDKERSRAWDYYSRKFNN